MNEKVGVSRCYALREKCPYLKFFWSKCGKCGPEKLRIRTRFTQWWKSYWTAIRSIIILMIIISLQQSEEKHEEQPRRQLHFFEVFSSKYFLSVFLVLLFYLPIIFLILALELLCLQYIWNKRTCCHGHDLITTSESPTRIHHSKNSETAIH